MKAKYTWNIKPVLEPEIRAKYPELDPITLQLLWNREIKTAQEIDDFLNADYADLLDPFLILDMRKCVDRIFLALTNKQRVLIFGDYDADGVTGSTILYNTLQWLYSSLHQRGQFTASQLDSPATDLIQVCIPDRHTQGYGLSEDILATVLTSRPNLVITVDCGVTSIKPIQSLQDLGIDVIVIDHHSVPEIMPPAFGILVPKRPGDSYRFKDLCGAGLAFKLASALITELPTHTAFLSMVKGYEKWLLDLACIGTIADMVPLVGENRIIVRYGLYVLAKTRNLGLRTLIEQAGIKKEVNELDGRDSWQISVHSVGFQLAPRINSAGRIAHANQAFTLFTTKDTALVENLSQELNQLNEKRKLMTEKVLQEVRARLEGYANLAQTSVIFEGDPDWPVGVLGIVASRLVEEYYRPVVLYQIQAHKYVASARSIPQVNLAEIIQNVRELLISGGGHSQAAGLAFHSHQLDILRSALIQEVRQVVDPNHLSPYKLVDLELAAQEINWDLYDIFYRLAPFGMHNPNPIFLVRMMRIEDIKVIGQDKNHIRLDLVSQSQLGQPVSITAIGFKFGFIVEHLHKNDLVDLLFHLEVNEWGGNRSLQMQILDIASSQ